ncbi:MAG: hypothetical protein LUG12_09235 [Erysipelotrichaceae bacterium]|nr:hypothetical protein [Erysipelotrichaceae bacterium]
MRKLKLRCLVGFPFGVFTGYTLLLILRLSYFQSFALTGIDDLNLIIQYFMFGSVGLLCVALCTMLEKAKKTTTLEFIRHVIVMLINEFIICFIGNITNSSTMIIFVFILDIVVLLILNYLVFKKKDFGKVK